MAPVMAVNWLVGWLIASGLSDDIDDDDDPDARLESNKLLSPFLLSRKKKDYGVLE
jgi:hypothetical protein